MASAWTDSGGNVLADAGGNVIYDTTCCCLPCPQCSTIGSEIQIEFTADLNLNGACATCAEWIAAWVMKPMTAAQVASLAATYPATFPGGSPTDSGCWFGLFSGLPCGANFMVGEIQAGGATGYAVLVLTIGWTNGTFVRLQFTNTVTPTTSDCVTNLTRPNQGVSGSNLGYSSGGAPPCDFLQLYFSANWPNVIITMVA